MDEGEGCWIKVAMNEDLRILRYRRILDSLELNIDVEH